MCQYDDDFTRMLYRRLVVWSYFLGKTRAKIWRYIAPIAGRLLPLKSPIYALPLDFYGDGFHVGWLILHSHGRPFREVP